MMNNSYLITIAISGTIFFFFILILISSLDKIREDIEQNYTLHFGKTNIILSSKIDSLFNNLKKLEENIKYPIIKQINDQHYYIEKIRRDLISFKPFLTLTELQIYTGLSENQIKRLINKQQIPYLRPNKVNYIFERSKIDQWILSRKIKVKDSYVKKIRKYNKDETGE